MRQRKLLLGCSSQEVAIEAKDVSFGLGGSQVICGVLGRDPSLSNVHVVILNVLKESNQEKEEKEEKYQPLALYAVRRGIPVVSRDWLTHCVSEGKWCMEGVKDFGVFSAQEVCKIQSSTLFEGEKVKLSRLLGSHASKLCKVLLSAWGVRCVKEEATWTVVPNTVSTVSEADGKLISFDALLQACFTGESVDKDKVNTVKKDSQDEQKDQKDQAADNEKNKVQSTDQKKTVKKDSQDEQKDQAKEENMDDLERPLKRKRKATKDNKAGKTRRTSKEKEEKDHENEKKETLDAAEGVSVHSFSDTEVEANKRRGAIILATSGLPVEEADVVLQAAKRIPNGTKAVRVLEDEFADKATHVIVPTLAREKRTIKVLNAIARGAWVVKASWLYNSLEKGHWVEERPHEATDAFPGCRIMREVKDDKRLLAGRRVYIAGKTKPSPAVLKHLVKSAGGVVADSQEKADFVIAKKTYPQPHFPETWLFDAIQNGVVHDLPPPFQDKENYLDNSKANKTNNSKANKTNNNKTKGKAVEDKSATPKKKSQKEKKEQHDSRRRPKLLSIDDVFKDTPEKEKPKNKKSNPRRSGVEKKARQAFQYESDNSDSEDSSSQMSIIASPSI